MFIEHMYEYIIYMYITLVLIVLTVIAVPLTTNIILVLMFYGYYCKTHHHSHYHDQYDVYGYCPYYSFNISLTCVAVIIPTIILTTSIALHYNILNFFFLLL